MKRLTYIKLCFILLIILIGATVFCAGLLRTPVYVSMAEILVDPDKFHGKYVQTEGVWQYKFEDHNLYFNEESRTDIVNSGAIWLEIPEEIHNQYYEQIVGMNGRYVSVSGKFNSKNKGHYDMSVGAFEKIISCEIID